MSEETTKVNGLTTPALADGEFMDAKDEFLAEEKKPSALDIATNIETKVKSLFEQVEKDDEEVNRRLTKLTKMVEELHKSLTS
ncbi:CIC11C00000000371 [Sungouiella intermedia]|uniref:CIC11C00000000371 n=1 Tax=Sungouiella intermedia TaxID=45354 RepID=A0A1L0DAW0_9ASCO|nr:CIC11C00000000371 [[Candida] intermedia]